MKTMCSPGYHHNGFVATYAHLPSVRFEHSCHGSLMTNTHTHTHTHIYIHIFVCACVCACVSI